eukprot:4361878-Amphidinium_carterae.1
MTDSKGLIAERFQGGIEKQDCNTQTALLSEVQQRQSTVAVLFLFVPCFSQVELACYDGPQN